MKRFIMIVISLLTVFFTPLVSSAIDVGITIGIPSPLRFAGPPDVVVVPSGDAYVYMVPDTPGLYFYDDYWYRYDNDRWYRSRKYDGSWHYIERHRVPGYIIDVPPDYYRRLPRGYHRIPYRDLNKNWRDWGRRKYWNKYDWYKREQREHKRWRREMHYDRGRHGRDRYDEKMRYNRDRYDDRDRRDDYDRRDDRDRYDDRDRRDDRDNKAYPDDREDRRDRR